MINKKNYYSLYNENLIDETENSRFKNLLSDIFIEQECFVMICKGDLNPDEKIVDYNKLIKLIKQSPISIIKEIKSDEIFLRFRFESLQIHYIMEVISCYASVLIINYTNNYDAIINKCESKTPIFKSRYSLEYYVNITEKGIYINNIQHYINIVLNSDYLKEIKFTEKYCEASNEYNLGLTPIKEYK